LATGEIPIVNPDDVSKDVTSEGKRKEEIGDREKEKTGAKEERVYALDEVSLQGLHHNRADTVARNSARTENVWRRVSSSSDATFLPPERA